MLNSGKDTQGLVITTLCDKKLVKKNVGVRIVNVGYVYVTLLLCTFPQGHLREKTNIL